MKKFIVLIFVVLLLFSLSGCEKKCETCHETGFVKCKSCDSGSITCTVCNGKPYENCGYCSGKGKISKKCTECDKNGNYITNRPGALIDEITGKSTYSSGIKCFYCNGTKTKKENCPECDGIGRFNECTSCSASGKTYCKHCNGSAKVTCSSCNGDGKTNY